jgi:hypothetical protein
MPCSFISFIHPTVPPEQSKHITPINTDFFVSVLDDAELKEDDQKTDEQKQRQHKREYKWKEV